MTGGPGAFGVTNYILLVLYFLPCLWLRRGGGRAAGCVQRMTGVLRAGVELFGGRAGQDTQVEAGIPARRIEVCRLIRTRARA